MYALYWKHYILQHKFYRKHGTKRYMNLWKCYTFMCVMNVSLCNVKMEQPVPNTHTHTHSLYAIVWNDERYHIEVFWKKCKTSFLRATFSISVATFSHKICNILLWMKWNNENCDIYIKCVQCEWKCPFAKNVLKSHIIVS